MAKNVVGGVLQQRHRFLNVRGQNLPILYDPFQVRISKYDAIIQLKKRLKTTMSRSAISQRIYSRHAFKLLLQQETCMHLKFPYI